MPLRRIHFGIVHPIEFQENARRFLYYQLFRTSLDFSNFLVTDPDIPGGVLLRDLDLNSLNPEVTEEISIMANGILQNLKIQTGILTLGLE